MQVRATNQAPKTIKQAKADFKRYGPRISSQQVRIDEREGELYRRAEKIRESEKKRKLAKQRKQEREDRERETRRRLNIASQKPNIPRSQFSLSGFVKTVKPLDCNTDSKQTYLAEQEPWTDDELDDDSLLVAVAPVGLAQDIEKKDTWMDCPFIEASLPSSSFGSDLDASWEDCFESNAQIERDMSVEFHDPTVTTSRIQTDTSHFMISTQDMSFSSVDLDEPGIDTATSHDQYDAKATRVAQDKNLMPPPVLPLQRSAAVVKSSCRFVDTDPFLDGFPLSTQDFRGIAC